ncbi:hypothetical protein QBC46DRAFT_460692 [Diplogelasinospora grovesii]|uniref:Uncharacterized protein n=1 Tax=Diplogelasinospora grovesii TaxID=303347 RepID=A0AAN6S252_9PEZI|nr:hypothetical protein QBC46DRAFT_460692 [Diplogelasinospora grovesii]
MPSLCATRSNNAQNRKRARADDLSQEYRPNKKIKSRGRLYESSNFPPEFWDNLSKPALRPAAPAVYTTDLARFARHGGPDLRHLRGVRLHYCPEPNGAVHTMASSRSSASSSRRTKSTKTTNATTATPGRSSAYDKAFEQHLFNNNVYLNGRKSKPNCGTDFYQPRPSLSPSRGSTNIPNSGEALFNNLESITNGATVNAKPDFYDGARFSDVDKKVREELDGLIIPTKNLRRPVAPNFFLKAKAPEGGAAVAKRQASLDGAIGARAMQVLQNYGEEEPAYDRNAYTYSSTYYAGTGTLQLYAHHVTPPTAPGGRPEYHMTQLNSYAMTGKRERFVEGATAFRNARDLAKRHRNTFIQAANSRACQANAEAPPEAEITVAIDARQDKDSTSNEFVDCKDYVGSQAVSIENHAASRDVDKGPVLPQYLYAEDEECSQESTSLNTLEPAISLATSFTSSFSTHSQTGSKRNKASPSPPLNP